MKLLLTSVFGSYEVDNDYGRKLLMELFHNQITREQGVCWLRMTHPFWDDGKYFCEYRIDWYEKFPSHQILEYLKDSLVKGCLLK